MDFKLSSLSMALRGVAESGSDGNGAARHESEHVSSKCRAGRYTGNVVLVEQVVQSQTELGALPAGFTLHRVVKKKHW